MVFILAVYGTCFLVPFLYDAVQTCLLYKVRYILGNYMANYFQYFFRNHSRTEFMVTVL